MSKLAVAEISKIVAVLLVDARTRLAKTSSSMMTLFFVFAFHRIGRTLKKMAHANAWDSDPNKSLNFQG